MDKMDNIDQILILKSKMLLDLILLTNLFIFLWTNLTKDLKERVNLSEDLLKAVNVKVVH